MRFIPGQAPNKREEDETRKTFTGAVEVVCEVNVATGKVKRRTLTYNAGLLTRVSELSAWE